MLLHPPKIRKRSYLHVIYFQLPSTQDNPQHQMKCLIVDMHPHILNYDLKGQSHEIFVVSFFPQTAPPGPIRDVLGPF